MGNPSEWSMPGTSRQSAVPTLSIPTYRSSISRATSNCSNDTERMDELSKVKQELEEALRQVKMEMREGGASVSQCGRSTTRSSVSRASSICSSNAEGWELTGNIASKRNRKLATQRGRVRLDIHDKSSKPLVKRPTRSSKQDQMP